MDSASFGEQELRYLGARTGAPLHEINALCLTLLVTAARALAAPQASAINLVHHLQESLLAMNTSGRARAAHCDFLLVDLRFQELDWWQAISHRPTRPCSDAGASAYFSRQAAIRLARATLTYAWHAARLNRDIALVSLGISPSVMDVITTLRLSQLDDIASHQFRHVRPRWETHPDLWKQLLQAAQYDDAEFHSNFNLRALQLLVGELMTNSTKR